jgi:hypothetical protein
MNSPSLHNSIDYDNLSKSLTRLIQNTIVSAYQEAFERLSHQVNGLLESFLIGCFIAESLDVKIKQAKKNLLIKGALL